MNISQEVIKRVSPYMKSKGFLRSGRNFYYITNDIAYCIALDTPGGFVYVTAYVMPLYVPCETRYYTYGNRLNTLWSINLPPLRRDDDINAKDEWCKLLCSSIEEVIIPFYKEIGTAAMLAEYVENKTYLSSTTFSCPEVFIERLKMYTYLYLRDFSKTDAAIKNYRNLLMTSPFLIGPVRQKYLDEIGMAQSLIRSSEQDVSIFFSKIADLTRKVLL